MFRKAMYLKDFIKAIVSSFLLIRAGKRKDSLVKNRWWSEANKPLSVFYLRFINI